MASNTPQESLYHRLGGEHAIARLVELFYARVLADPDLRRFFQDVPMQRLKNMQKEFFTIALGGPNRYSDFSLSKAHKGHNIEVAHFKKFVDLLFATLAKFELSDEDRYAVISTINTYVGDIVDDTESLTD